MTTLTELFSNIAGAIRSKTGGTAQIAAENFPAEIAAITTGTDTSDATAVAANIEAGKTAYVKGQKVTGNLQTANDITSFATPQEDNGYILLGGALGYKTILKPTSNVRFKSAYENFGDATAADVAAGKTFTGADGLKVEGTAAVGEIQYKTGYFTPTSNTAAVNITGVGFKGKNFICLVNELVGNSDRVSGGNHAIASLGYINGMHLCSYFMGTGNATYFYGSPGVFSDNTAYRISIVFNDDGLTITPLYSSSSTGGYYLFQFVKKKYAYMIWA